MTIRQDHIILSQHPHSITMVSVSCCYTNLSQGNSSREGGEGIYLIYTRVNK